MKNTIVQMGIVCSYLSKRCSTLMSVRSKNDTLMDLHGIGTIIGALSREI